jgi:hypothetical protein
MEGKRQRDETEGRNRRGINRRKKRERDRGEQT